MRLAVTFIQDGAKRNLAFSSVNIVDTIPQNIAF